MTEPELDTTEVDTTPEPEPQPEPPNGEQNTDYPNGDDTTEADPDQAEG